MDDESELSAEDANRIADAVEEIERNVSRLRRHQTLPLAEYQDPSNLETREAVERKFVKLTAATVDAAETILRAERGTPPDHRKKTITGLREEGIVDEELASKLHEAIGFRDVLAHSYGPIVDDDIVYDALQHSLDRYVEFAEAVQDYLEHEGG